MSTSDSSGFGKFVPGFDFLQSLAKGAAGGLPQMPNLTNWVAPSLDIEELDKRISELKTVMFWLDQNATALKATIQALEVQKMTLATLKGMNVGMAEVASAFAMKPAPAAEKPASRPVSQTAAASKAPSPQSEAGVPPEADGSKDKPQAPAGEGLAGLVDPIQLWGALTQQFQQIAATALKDAASNSALDSTQAMAANLTKEAIKATQGAAAAVAGVGKAGPAAKPAAKKAVARKAAAKRPAQVKTTTKAAATRKR